MIKFTARPYQDLIIDHIHNTPRCGVWAGMGLGKTVSTLMAINNLSIIDDRPTLVLAPKRVAQSTWPDEAKKWSDLSNIEVSAVVGTLAQRQAALAKPANVFTTNYEQLPWLVEHFGKKWPFKRIVSDESTRLKGFRVTQGGKRARALGKVAHKHADQFIELTGTPSPNGLQDLWGQAWFLDEGFRLGRSYQAFIDRWFKSERVGQSEHAVRISPMPFANSEIQKRLQDLCISLEAKDWFDLAEPIVNVVRVELPVKARRLYDDMESEMFLSVNDNDVEAFNAASKTIKCLQLANGSIYTDEKGAWAEIHDVKLQALESIIEESAGMPVLVSYQFKSDLQRLMRTFPKGRVLDDNPQTIIDWNKGKVPILFAHPQSAGHGLNLQDGGNIIVFFSHWWNLEEFQQIIERIGPVRQLQAGHNRPVFIYHIVAADTLDEMVMERRESKREVQDILMSSMKRKKHES
jgi:SNF2 family DNA or RNA helicase